MEKLKLGVIGAGGIVCRMHLPDLAESSDFEVTVISGRREHRLKHQCQEFNIPRWTQDYDEQELYGTFSVHPRRLVEMMADGAAERWFFPAKVFDRFQRNRVIG